MHVLEGAITFAAITVTALCLTAGPIRAGTASKPLEDRIVVLAVSVAPSDAQRTDFALAA